MKENFFEIFKQFNFLEKKVKKMNKENDFVVLSEVVKKCSVHPYFIMDICSGELLSIFSVPNLDTAIRSFKMSLDNMPENLVHDCILVKFSPVEDEKFDVREVVMEGKDYLDEWKKKKEAQAARFQALSKGM